MIEKITDEQWQDLYKLREEYRAIGLSTEPINKPETERIIKGFYRALGKQEPRFLYFSSPILCAMAPAFFKKFGDQMGAQMEDQVWDQMRDQMWAQMWARIKDRQMRDQMRAQMRDQMEALGALIWAQMRDQMRAQIGAQMWDQMRAQMHDQMRALGNHMGDQMGTQLDYHYLYGNLNAPWLCYFRAGQKIGVSFFNKDLVLLNQWEELAKNAFHWWPREGVCICSDRPRYLSFDSNRLLHADGRKAIEFSDGWGVYANSGRRLPEKYGAVKIKDWQSKWLLEEKNAELKMVLIKNIGYQKLFHELEAKKIDSWREYELYRIENVDVEPVHLLKMVCPSTQHVHIGRVPPSIIFAEEAATARNKGIHPSEFAMET